MANFLNDKPFSHHCRYGTRFYASRCDFRDGVEVTEAPKDKAKFASDVAEI